MEESKDKRSRHSKGFYTIGAGGKRTAKSEALKKKYTSPTGSKHRIGSAKHKYWEDIERRGKEDKKYGAGD